MQQRKHRRLAARTLNPRATPEKTVAEQIRSTEEIPDRKARRPIRETPDKNKSSWRDGFLSPAQDGTPFAYAGSGSG